MEVIVNPGDVLYLPPYVWHTVETLSPSVSLVSLSHDDGLRKTMESIYAHDFKFDLLVEREGKVAALRLFLDLAVTMLYVQPSLGKRFVHQLPYHTIASSFTNKQSILLYLRIRIMLRKNAFVCIVNLNLMNEMISVVLLLFFCCFYLMNDYCCFSGIHAVRERWPDTPVRC